MSAASFARPRHLDEALGMLAAYADVGVRPVLLCGGTDWMVDRHLAPRTPVAENAAAIVDISGVSELADIERREENGQICYRLGAGVSYAALRRHPGLVREAPILGAMARDVGAVQIQERGTLGGNLATGSPAADGVPVLMALGARVVLRSATATRAVPVEGFYTGYRRSVMAPDEMIVAVEFALAPTPGDGKDRWFWRKVGTRLAQAISKVALAGTARIEGGRIQVPRLGMASVGPVVAPLFAVRAELAGKPPAAVSAERLQAALREDISPIDDVRSTREYRLHVAGRLMEQFVAGLAEPR